MNCFKIFLLLNLILFLSSCGTAKKAFTNQKKNSSDEFLVEKKSPLVMPPDYSELPVPKSLSQSVGNDETNIKSLIKNNNESDSTNINNKTEHLSLEKSLLEKIKKN